MPQARSTSACTRYVAINWTLAQWRGLGCCQSMAVLCVKLPRHPLLPASGRMPALRAQVLLCISRYCHRLGLDVAVPGLRQGRGSRGRRSCARLRRPACPAASPACPSAAVALVACSSARAHKGSPVKPHTALRKTHLHCNVDEKE